VKRRTSVTTAAAVLVPCLAFAGVMAAQAAPHSAGATGSGASRPAAATSATATPIKHTVVIYDENVSFDHYFGTYPNAANPAGSPAFRAKAGTPSVNGLTPTLLQANPNAKAPTRLGRDQAVTCDMNHGYAAEQQAFDHGLMDKFVEKTDSGDCSAKSTSQYYRPGLVMDYYDGNTVTGLWNYAQNFALSDNSFGTGFGPSTPGARSTSSRGRRTARPSPAPRPASRTGRSSPTRTPRWTTAAAARTPSRWTPRTRTSVTCSTPRT